MSEYQYYEFQAIDRPLTPGEMAELRKISSRASITATRFHNVYHLGDFRGDPLKLMEKYFDRRLRLCRQLGHASLHGAAAPRRVHHPDGTLPI
jgi:hypothetical protein